MKIELEHADVSQLRLELWSASGEALYDSGPVAGSGLEIGLDAIPPGEDLRYELRAWDASGELVLSQLSTLSGREQIFSIDFESVPAGTQVEGGGNAITLEGDVHVTNDLSVAGNATVSNILGAFAIDVGQLRDPSGGPFFGSCNTGSSIRSIFPNGAVSCEPTSSAGDDLGDHQATQSIVFRDPDEGLVGSGGAQLLTGPLGHSFFTQRRRRQRARRRRHRARARRSNEGAAGLDRGAGSAFAGARMRSRRVVLFLSGDSTRGA